MRIFRKMALAAILIAAFLGINTLLCHLMIPYQFTRVKVHHIENEPYQDLILGTSHGVSALDPETLTAVTDRSSYNAAAGGQYVIDNYYLLLDACRKHKVERVIYEYDPAYWVNVGINNPNSRYLESVFEPSMVRLAYFRDICMSSDIRYALMPWFLYDKDPEQIRKNLKIKSGAEYRSFSMAPFSDAGQTVMDNGFIAISDGATGSREIPDLFYNEQTRSAEKKQLKYFKKMLKYCASMDIEVLVVTTPVPERTYEPNEAFYKESHEKMSALAGEYGFTYVDYSAPDLAEGENVPGEIWDDSCFSDAEGHMRVSAAERFTSLLAGEYLM